MEFYRFDKQSRVKNDIRKSHNDLVDGFVEAQDAQVEIGDQLAVVKNHIDKVKPAEEPEQPEEPQVVSGNFVIDLIFFFL